MSILERTPHVEGRGIEDNLRVLREIQAVDSKITGIIQLRGELPVEVRALEVEMEGIQQKIDELEAEMANHESEKTRKRHEIQAASALAAKYTDQLNSVRNNREYESLQKEIRFQQLEIELREKQIREITARAEITRKQTEQYREHQAVRQADLEAKRSALEAIIAETRTEEEALRKHSEALADLLPPQLLTSYRRIQGNMRNGVAVVPVRDEACGGCHFRIPPQRQIDIMIGKRLILCEHCGRILIADEAPAEEES